MLLGGQVKAVVPLAVGGATLLVAAFWEIYTKRSPIVSIVRAAGLVLHMIEHPIGTSALV